MRILDGKNSDPGWKKVGSGINIPGPQHCIDHYFSLGHREGRSNYKRSLQPLKVVGNEN
jgi:hypothetical protein